MRQAVKENAKRHLASLGWRALRLAGRRADEPRVGVIMYHSAGGGAPMSLAPDRLDAHFEAISRHYPRSSTVVELVDDPAGTAPESRLAITFDDGFEDNHRVVLPLLVRHGLKATFFVCSGFVDERSGIAGRHGSYHGLRAMSWSQVRELADAGMEIGAHTDTHPLLSRLSPADQETEMRVSKERIEAEIRRPVVSFAIPYGNRGTYTGVTLDLAARHFRACCTTRFATNPLAPATHGGMAVFDRVQPSPQDSPAIVLEKLSGRWDAMRLLQRGRTRV